MYVRKKDIFAHFVENYILPSYFSNHEKDLNWIFYAKNYLKMKW